MISLSSVSHPPDRLEHARVISVERNGFLTSETFSENQEFPISVIRRPHWLREPSCPYGGGWDGNHTSNRYCGIMVAEWNAWWQPLGCSSWILHLFPSWLKQCMHIPYKLFLYSPLPTAASDMVAGASVSTKMSFDCQAGRNGAAKQSCSSAASCLGPAAV